MKSFIERAIELAKSQRRQGEPSRYGRDEPLEDAPSQGKSRRRRASSAPLPSNGHPASHLPPIDLSRSATIVTDSGLLRHNRVLVESDTKQPAEGAYRMLRTRVMRQMRTNGWRRLGITAASANEGKTLTAINLALSIAAERVQPVVLVDLDLRRPRIHRYLGIAENQFVDVADFLEGRTNSLDQLVLSLGEQGLSCILSARPIDRSSDLLASPQGQAFLNDLADRLPDALLIFDLPPLLSTDDPLVVAPRLDALLLVVAEKGCSRSDVASAAKLLDEFNVLGTVLNKSVERGDHSYYTY
ncbi:MAG: CpsD/CapB family tyrosine-protein kinase [Steroidobacteraceae bacterium]